MKTHYAMYVCVCVYLKLIWLSAFALDDALDVVRLMSWRKENTISNSSVHTCSHSHAQTHEFKEFHIQINVANFSIYFSFTVQSRQYYNCFPLLLLASSIARSLALDLIMCLRVCVRFFSHKKKTHRLFIEQLAIDYWNTFRKQIRCVI